MGFSTTVIFKMLFFVWNLISWKKFESYSFLRELFKSLLFKFLFGEISPRTKIVSFDILLFPEIFMLFIISEFTLNVK